MLHSDKYLTGNSRFFAAALARQWKEAQTRTITFPEDDPRIFSIYLIWLYTRTFVITSDSFPEHHNPKFRARLICHLAYILGDKLGDDDFCDAAITTLFQHCLGARSWIRDREVALIYENTCDGSPLRQLVVDQWIWLARAKWCEALSGPSGLKGLPQDFYLDYFCASVQVKAAKWCPAQHDAPWVLNPCAYHLHKSLGGLCYLDGRLRTGPVLAVPQAEEVIDAD